VAQLVSILKQQANGLQFEKEVIERRAEMAAQCECLAAWVEGRECICNKAVDVPLSTEGLNRAHKLVGEIEGCEKRLKQINGIEGDAECIVELDAKRYRRQHPGGGLVYYEDDAGHYHSAPRVTLPKAVLIAALKEERLKLLIELQKTGIVSVGGGNIRTIPK
jgi:hypothetical protein